MNTPYDEYKSTKEWKVIKNALKELELNHDLLITTHPDYVIGFILKKLKNMD